MSDFPKIDSPCPLRFRSLPSAERNFCTHCSRRVHNLDGMSVTQRRAFLAGCSGSVCVAYTVPRRRNARAVAAGLGLAAALSFAVTAADDTAAPAAPAEPASVAAAAAAGDGTPDEPQNVELIDAEDIVLLGAVVTDRHYIDEDEDGEPPQDEWMDGDLPELLLENPDDLREPAEFVEPPEFT